MEEIIYITFFLIGIVFGSFFTLAVYRIPRKENILYGRSHCTSCNHKLDFWDLIPILSYLFLRGKCRYCGEKIRIRYLLLEVFSGFVFLFIALTHGTQNMIELCFIYLFIAGMFIIAGIDKERLEIPDSLCIYGFCIALVHFIDVAVIEHQYIEYMIGFVAIPLLFFVLDKLFLLLKKDEVEIPIGCGDIKYLAMIGLMFGYKMQIISIVLSTFIALIGMIIHKYKEIPWGYYITIAAVVVIIIEPYMTTIYDLM